MHAAATPTRCCLYDERQLTTVLDAMARRAAARLGDDGPVALVGVVRRGHPLATLLAARLQPLLGGRALPVYPLQLKRYADDLALLHPETALVENPELAALDLAKTTLLVVDDVLFGGYSLLRATGWLVQAGARDVHTAVLVDRGVARVPVRADITGLHLDVAPGDIIECQVPPYEPAFRITLCRGGAA